MCRIIFQEAVSRKRGTRRPYSHVMEGITKIKGREILLVEHSFQHAQLTNLKDVAILSVLGSRQGFQSRINKIQVEGTVTRKVKQVASNNGENCLSWALM